MKRNGLQGVFLGPNTQAVMVWDAKGRVTVGSVPNQYDPVHDGAILKAALYAGNKAMQEFDRNLGAYQRKDRPS